MSDLLLDRSVPQSDAVNPSSQPVGPDDKDRVIRQLTAINRDLMKEIRDLRVIGEVVRSITGTLLIEEVLSGILRGLQETLSFDRAVLGLVHSDAGVEEFKLGIGPGVKQLMQRTWPVSEDDPLWAKLMSDPSPRVFSGSERIPEFVREVFPDGFVKAPILIKGQLIGSVMCTLPSRVSERELKLMQILVEHAGIALENGRLYYDIIRSQEELQRTQRQLVDAEKMAAVGQLAVSINHEINNPLCTIQMSAQMMRFDLEQSAPELLPQIDMILQAVERISKVTRKVSDLKRVEATEYLPNQFMVELK